jgi:hypothetical protein
MKQPATILQWSHCNDPLTFFDAKIGLASATWNSSVSISLVAMLLGALLKLRDLSGVIPHLANHLS